MSRKFLLSASTLVLTLGGLLCAAPQVGAQVFVGTPTPQQFAGQGQPSTRNGEWPTNGADVKFTRRSVVALDAKTGELIWSHSLREGHRAEVSARQLSGRGVSYWTDGRGDERIIYVTTGYRLVELNAKTGALIPSFGDNGILDIKVGVVKGN